jgi:hypothetical protein
MSKTILKGVFVEFPPASYPGRLYGKYDWDWNKNEWVLSDSWKRMELIEERIKKINKLRNEITLEK